MHYFYWNLFARPISIKNADYNCSEIGINSPSHKNPQANRNKQTKNQPKTKQNKTNKKKPLKTKTTTTTKTTTYFGHCFNSDSKYYSTPVAGGIIRKHDIPTAFAYMFPGAFKELISLQVYML